MYVNQFQATREQSVNEYHAVLTGKINLVDLAGSENNKVGIRNFSGKRATLNPESSSLETTPLEWPNLPLSTSPYLFSGKSFMLSTPAL
jgi:hypothetical protein